ncbi:MAG: MmgE/PrpD family protein [bacterium]
MRNEQTRGDYVVASFIASTSWVGLADAVKQKIRMALLDTLGAAVAGTQTRIAAITSDYAAETWSGNESTLLLGGKRASRVGASFANSYAANALDIDDNGQYMKGHPGSQVVSTALAVGEAVGSDGSQALTAMVVGYEVAHRMARCWHDHHSIYAACGSWGSVACAAVTAKLADLGVEEVINALGVAEYHAPHVPIMRDVSNPAMVKHGHGWGAATGIIAAELASRGFTGIPSLFAAAKYSDWVEGIGREFLMVDGVTWKQYACCAWAHPAIKAAKAVVDRYNVCLSDIRRIAIEAPDEAVQLGTMLPTTTEEAQFNLAWPVAAMLVDGEVGPRQVLEQRLDDEEIRQLAKRVEAVESKELTQRYSDLVGDDSTGKYGSAVRITLRDGTELASGIVEEEYTYPQRGWDWKRVEDKFRWLSEPVLGKRRVAQAIEIVSEFERVGNVRELTEVLSD